MRAVVNDFNASQTRIFVDYSTISQMDRKLMLATSGGVPPDVAGVAGRTLPAYTENNALTPLDRLAARNGIKRERSIDALWGICSYRDHLWALPTTPACLALIWNKKLFREAGLDPEQPPLSIAELERFNERLTRRRLDGSLAICGLVPAEPEQGWYATSGDSGSAAGIGTARRPSRQTRPRTWPRTTGSPPIRSASAPLTRIFHAPS